MSRQAGETAGTEMAAVTGAKTARVPATQHSTDEMVIEGGRGHASLAGLRELWRYREVLWSFTVRRLKVRYKEAAFGIGWAVLQPVATALVFALFIGRVAHVGGEGVPYFAFALAGMVLWTYFSGVTTLALVAIVGEQGILRKVYFPREILPAAGVVSGLVDLAAGCLTLFVAVTIAVGPPSWTWLAAPIPLVLTVILSLAVALAVSSINLYYRDVGYIIPVLLQVGIFASPVVYSLERIPSSWRTSYAVLNPMATAIDDLRRALLHHRWPSWPTTAGAYGWSVFLLVCSYVLFKRLERDFADRV